MPRFKPYNHDQHSMVVINFQEQLQPGTFEHAIHYLIEHKLDQSVFYPKYQNDDTGRRAYDPAILLKIILFAYSKGITSSRQIQWCCETNILFKALSCDIVPHFTTLASFVSGHAEAIEDLFEQVLLVCHEQDLLGNELIAIDGCKMASNAAKEWSGTFRELGEERAKLRRMIRHNLDEHRRRDPAFAHQHEKYGHRHPQPPVKREYFPASAFDFNPVQLTCRCPGGHFITHRCTRTDHQGRQRAYFEGKLSQCRHCPLKQLCMQNPASAHHRKGSGRQVSFALSTQRQPNYTDWMKHRIDSPAGKVIYGHRMSVVEPVFGNLSNKRLTRFSLRTKRKVQGQWQLYCLVHNIEKLVNYGRLAA